MFSSIFVPVLVAAAIAGAPDALPVSRAQAPAEENAPTLALEPLLAAVVERNPDLVALDAQRAAALDRAIAAGSLPHPMLGFAIRNLPVDTFSFTDDMMTMKEVMLRQQFPWFGKRELRREAVEQNAKLAEAEKASQALLLRQATTDAYANLWLSTSSVRLVEEQQQALERFRVIARGRYAAGGGSQSDLLRADVELARITDPLLELEEMETAARAALATLLHRPLASFEGSPAAPPLPALPADPAPLYARIEAHPELRALGEQAERSEIEARLALRDRWPDPEVGVMWGFRTDMPDMVGAEVMFQIPVFAGSKENRLAAASRSEARSALLQRESRADTLLGEARTAWAAAKRQRDLIRLYDEEIVPRAERNVQSAIGSYQAGSVDFLTLLDAQVQLQAQQLEALRARANYVRQLARLARATGVSLFDESLAAPEVDRG
ncbi:TolC family protein [Vulgatibacter sp.]|uniref:TolC family protein n=1 Tax=Vulgatibacter sp. TaxID=1971226 RepID=UPI00356895B9